MLSKIITAGSGNDTSRMPPSAFAIRSCLGARLVRYLTTLLSSDV
jgi:hypothetical protein